MPQAADWVDVINALGPAIGVAAVVLGTVLAGYSQARIVRKQSRDAHDSQMALLDAAHRQQLALLGSQQKREEDLRIRQYAESDRADRLVVIEYVDLLLPRLCDPASIYYLASDNKVDNEELKKFLQLKRFMSATALDPAHPEANLGLRMAFLLFQLTAAMRLALQARWTRPLTDAQVQFLSHWETHLEPIICSGRYPGKELLYREQVEIITEEMLVAPEATKLTRPLNWREFCDKYEADPVIKDLSETVASKLRYMFDEANALPPRKATQCRLAIMALYLIKLSEEAGNESWSWRKDGLWKVVADWFKWEHDKGQDPKWFVYEYGDVAARAGVAA